MFVLRFVRMLMIALLTIISGLILTVAFWWPTMGLYYFISHRFWGPGLLWASGARVSGTGLDQLSGLPPAIYYANHRSYLDIPAMMTALPLPLYFIAKMELRKVPFLGWAMRAVGMVFVDRKNQKQSRNSMQRAGEAIRGGKNIAAYPEGTRSPTSALLPFKKGTFALALREGIPLVPVALDGTQNINLNKGPGRPTPIRLTVGKPILPEEVRGMTPLQLAELARRRLMDILNPKQATAEADGKTTGSA